MIPRAPFLRLFGLLSLLFLSACARHDERAAGTKSAEDRFAIKVGDVVVQMQVAALPGELQRGLMFREKLARDEGMVFVFTRPQPQGFWMRNTPLPLDIGYFDGQGVLREIYPMYPHDERTVMSRSREIQFCLEMNQGWFKDRGVKPGAQLDLKALAEALRARGLKPEAAGLK